MCSVAVSRPRAQCRRSALLRADCGRAVAAGGRIPRKASVAALDALRRDAAGCTACPLWRDATQTVFGEGDARARIVLVGEQPGDAEDRAGRPFVGPAGRLLDQTLTEAGLPRESVYLTNAVKHFKWTPRGKRRIHKTPAQREIEACLQWLEGEVGAIAPRLVVALGATAARAMLGRGATVGAQRGRVTRRGSGPPVLVTVHPSYVLRVPPQQRGAARSGLVADLTVAARFLRRG